LEDISKTAQDLLAQQLNDGHKMVVLTSMVLSILRFPQPI